MTASKNNVKHAIGIKVEFTMHIIATLLSGIALGIMIGGIMGNQFGPAPLMTVIICGIGFVMFGASAILSY